MPEVENLPLAGGELRAREVQAFEGQKEALAKTAEAMSKLAAMQFPADLVETPRARFELMLRACLMGGVSSTPNVNGFINFAQELIDAVDAKFSQG